MSTENPFNKSEQGVAKPNQSLGDAVAEVSESQLKEAELNSFLKATLEKLYDGEERLHRGTSMIKRPQTTQEVQLAEPASQDYRALSNEYRQNEYGKYTLNPDMQSVNLESAQTFIPDLSEFNGKPIHQVMQHVVETYGATHHIPGIEYWKWIIENPDETPADIETNSWYYFPGSVIGNQRGGWAIPYGRLDSDRKSFVPYMSDLSDKWQSNRRVVLLQK